MSSLRALLLHVLAAGAALAVDLPYRIDPVAAPEPNGTTVLLWRFEEGAARDSTPAGNNGEIHGSPAEVAGRHGKALRFDGGRSAILFPRVPADTHVAGGRSEGVARIVDLWCRLEDRAPACILAMPGLGGLRLEFTSAGTLQLGGQDYDRLETATPVPLGRWFHVALLWRTFMQPNRIYEDGAGIELLVDGVGAGVAWDTRAHRADDVRGCFVCLGNSFERDAGFRGSIDEFRVSRGAAGVYEIVEQAFAGAEPDGPVARSDTYFRHPGARVLHESFDTEAGLRRIVPPDDPRFLPAAPPLVSTPGARDSGALFEQDTDVEGLFEEMETEFAREERGTAAAVAPVRGVRGRGLVVRGGEARLAVPTPAALPSGTLEFWFTPGNWDNLAVPPGRDASWSYEHRRAHLATVWGVPRQGGGEPRPLVSLRLDRADGAASVRPEYRAYFAQPAIRAVPHKWMHVLVTWSDRFPHLRTCELDGRAVRWASFAEEDTWRTHDAAFLTLGNGWDTRFDEVRLYAYPFEGVERANARADVSGDALLPWAEHSLSRTVKSLGKFPVHYGSWTVPGRPATWLSRTAGDWLEGWVTGSPARGPARVFFGFRPSVEAMIVAVAPDGADTVARAEVSLDRASAGQPVRGEIPAFENGKGGVCLPVGALPKGRYRLTGTLFDRGGAAIGTFESGFQREVHPEVACELGYVTEPPPPFTAVAVKGDTVGVVGRTYSLGADGNFNGIDVLGESILAGPIRFEADVDGRPAALSGTGRAWGACTPVQAEWSAAAEGHGLSIGVSARIEYDGLAAYELELRPKAGPVSVDRLSLQIPLRDTYARLFHVLGPNTGLRNPYVAGALKPGEGIVWDTRTDFTGRKLGRWPCQVWLGGMVRGLVWYADNDRGWVPADGEPSVTVTRAGDVVTLGLHLVRGPFTLDGLRRISYTLLATPPKPLPKDHRLWNRGDLDRAGKVAGRLTSCDSFAPWVIPCRASTFAYWPPDDDWGLVRLAVRRQRHTDHGKYPPGQALMMYHDKNKTPLHPSMLPYHGWSWGYCRYPVERINHMIHYMDRMIECGYDGVYIDDVFPFGDWNLEPVGPSYLFEDGSGKPPKHVGSAAGEYRQYLKRLYNVFRAHGKRPIITTHMTSTLGWPYHSFVTVAFDHEQSARFGPDNSTFMDAWPLDYLMTLDIPERSGLVTVPMLKADYLEGRTPLQKWATERSFQAVWMLFDHNMKLGGTVLKPYGGTEVEVHPFWRNEDLVGVEPVIDGPVTDRDLPKSTWWKMEHFRQSIGRRPLRVTLYRRKDRCLIVTANFLRRAVGCRLRIDLDALGVPPARRERITVEDVDTARPPDDTDLSDLHLAELGKRPAAPKPPGIDAPAGLLSGGGGGDDLSLLEEDPGAERREQFYNVTRDGDCLTFRVGAHNFRAMELRWGE